MIAQNEDKRIEIQKAYLYFLEQIIACHAGHTVICNDKIHFHFLQKHKKTERKKIRNPEKMENYQERRGISGIEKGKTGKNGKERKKEILPDDR